MATFCEYEMDTTEPTNYYRWGWTNLPKELKRNIISLLQFPDKQNMMLVNWECAQICQSLPNNLNELAVTELPSTAKTTLLMKWKNGEGKMVSRIVEYRGQNIRQTDCPQYTSEAVKAFIRIWRRSKIKNVVIEIPCFEGLSELWNANMYQPIPHTVVKYITIRTNDYRLVERSLQAVSNKKYEITLLTNDYGGMDTCIFDLEKVKLARSVILWSLTSNIRDHQLLSLSAQNIRIMSENITSDVILEILGDWKSGRRKLERLHISSPKLNIDEIVSKIECVCWKDLSDICQVIWREVDEEGYAYATKGSTFDSPAAFGLIISEGMPTFIFRIIKLTQAMSQILYERCGKKCVNNSDRDNVNCRIEEVTL